MDDPPPAGLRYSLPLAMAEFNCPACARQIHFTASHGRPAMVGRELVCRGCGLVLGRYTVAAGGWVWLEVVAAAGRE